MTIGSLLFAVVIGVRSGADMVPAYSYLSLTGAPLDADSLRDHGVTYPIARAVPDTR